MDSTKTIIVKTNVPATDINREILNSVIGQLSDGIWENSRKMESIWRDLSIITDGEYLAIQTGPRTSLHFESDDYIRNYFANKIKQIIKIEGDDHPTQNFSWDRSNRTSSVYLNYFNDVQVRDAYQVYDLLKGRTIKQPVPQSKAVEDIQRGDSIEGFGKVADIQLVELNGRQYMAIATSFGDPQLKIVGTKLRVRES